MTDRRDSGIRSRPWHGGPATSSSSPWRGVPLWAADGNSSLDATAGLCSRTSATAARRSPMRSPTQLRTLASHHIFGDHANGPALELARPRRRAVARRRRRLFFGTGGGEAIDTACKIVRRYWALSGQPQRTVIVSRRFAYHGTNAYGTSLSGIPAVQRRLRPARRRRRRGRPRRPGRTSPRVLDELDGRVAAFVGEPMIGAGGAIPPPDGYWPAVERICRERDVLLVCDEVISGFGRLGRWFGCRALRLHARPDHLCEGNQLRLRAAQRRRR